MFCSTICSIHDDKLKHVSTKCWIKYYTCGRDAKIFFRFIYQKKKQFLIPLFTTGSCSITRGFRHFIKKKVHEKRSFLLLLLLIGSVCSSQNIRIFFQRLMNWMCFFSSSFQTLHFQFSRVLQLNNVSLLLQAHRWLIYKHIVCGMCGMWI